MRVDSRFDNFFGIEFFTPIEKLLSLTKGYTLIIDGDIRNPFLNGTNKRYPSLGKDSLFRFHNLGNDNYKLSFFSREHLYNTAITLICAETGSPIAAAELILFPSSSSYYEAYFEGLKDGKYKMLFGYKVIS